MARPGQARGAAAALSALRPPPPPAARRQRRRWAQRAITHLRGLPSLLHLLPQPLLLVQSTVGCVSTRRHSRLAHPALLGRLLLHEVHRKLVRRCHRCVCALLLALVCGCRSSAGAGNAVAAQVGASRSCSCVRSSMIRLGCLETLRLRRGVRSRWKCR